jgi:hypothetical protein
MNSFNEASFRARVDNALKRVKTILDTNRNPQYPADVPHAYDDKYLLAESLTNNALGAYLVCYENLGLTEKQLTQLKDWSKTRSVTLRLKAEEKCKFLRKVVREVQSDTKSVGVNFVREEQLLTTNFPPLPGEQFDTLWQERALHCYQSHRIFLAVRRQLSARCFYGN